MQGSAMMQGMTAITPTARGRAQQRAIEWDPYGGMTVEKVSYEGMTQKAREGVAGSGEAGYLQFQARESREAVHDVWEPARETYALVNARDAVVPTGEETNLSQPVSAPDDSDRSGGFVTVLVQPDGLPADALKQAAQEGNRGGRTDPPVTTLQPAPKPDQMKTEEEEPPVAGNFLAAPPKKGGQKRGRDPDDRGRPLEKVLKTEDDPGSETESESPPQTVPGEKDRPRLGDPPKRSREEAGILPMSTAKKQTKEKEPLFDTVSGPDQTMKEKQDQLQETPQAEKIKAMATVSPMVGSLPPRVPPKPDKPKVNAAFRAYFRKHHEEIRTFYDSYQKEPHHFRSVRATGLAYWKLGMMKMGAKSKQGRWTRPDGTAGQYFEGASTFYRLAYFKDTDQATNAIMKLDDATIREVMVSPEFLYYQAHMKGIENAVLQMTTDAGATQIPAPKVFDLMRHTV